MEFVTYNADSGVASVYEMVGSVNEDLAPKFVGKLPGLDRRWTHFVSGWFRGENFSDILCYNSHNGEFAFYGAKGTGDIRVLRESEGWRKGWTQITPTYLGKSSRDGLLFYNSASGFAQVYSVAESSHISRLWDHKWRKGWTHILEGNFNSKFLETTTNLLFYNASTGLVQLYGLNHKGHMALAGEHSLDPGFSHVVKGKFGGKVGHDLLFYNSRSGAGKIYSTDSENGKIQDITAHEHLGFGWSHVVPVQTNWAQTIFCYNTTSGNTSLYRAVGRGKLHKSSTHFQLPVNITSIAAGNFV